MGYRNETEQLRHRVRELEDQLDHLRGTRRSPRAEVIQARVRRQSGILLVVACLGSAAALLCLVPTVGATLEARELSPREVARSPVGSLPEWVRFVGTPDVDRAFEHHVWGPDTFVPLREEPRVLLLCSWGCPAELRNELLSVRPDDSGAQAPFYAEADPEMPPEPAPTVALSPRLMRGQLSVWGSGDAPYPVGDELREAVQSYARRAGVPAHEIRIVELYSPTDDGTAPLWVMTAMILLAALGLWGMAFLHRRATRGEVPLATVADFQTRDPVMTLILSLVTLRLYEIYWLYRTTGQVRRITGRRDLVPWLDVALTFLTFGLWPFWAMYRNVEAVDELLEEKGLPLRYRGGVAGLIFGSFVCGIFQWLLVIKVQEAYNMLLIESLDEVPDPGPDEPGPPV